MYSEVIIIAKEDDLHNIIMASDLIIGRSTGAELEAKFLGKTVVDINYESVSDAYLIRKSGVALSVNDPNELEQTIQDALYDKDISKSLKEGRNKYKAYCVNKFDGKASIRVRKLIENILKI